jgi:hypothetical protein
MRESRHVIWRHVACVAILFLSAPPHPHVAWTFRSPPITEKVDQSVCVGSIQHMSDNLTEERWLSQSSSDLLEITFVYCVPFHPQVSIRLRCEGQVVQRLCQLKLVTNELLSRSTWVRYRTLIFAYLYSTSVVVSVCGTVGVVLCLTN